MTNLNRVEIIAEIKELNILGSMISEVKGYIFDLECNMRNTDETLVDGLETIIFRLCNSLVTKPILKEVIKGNINDEYMKHYNIVSSLEMEAIPQESFEFLNNKDEEMSGQVWDKFLTESEKELLTEVQELVALVN